MSFDYYNEQITLKMEQLRSTANKAEEKELISEIKALFVELDNEAMTQPHQIHQKTMQFISEQRSVLNGVIQEKERQALLSGGKRPLHVDSKSTFQSQREKLLQSGSIMDDILNCQNDVMDNQTDTVTELGRQNTIMDDIDMRLNETENKAERGHDLAKSMICRTNKQLALVWFTVAVVLVIFLVVFSIFVFK